MSDLQKVVDGLVAGGAKIWVTNSYNTNRPDGPLRVWVRKEDPHAVPSIPEMTERLGLAEAMRRGPLTNCRIVVTKREHPERGNGAWGDGTIFVEIYYGANGFADGKKVWNDVMSIEDAVAFCLGEMPNQSKIDKMRTELRARWAENKEQA